MVTVEEVKAGVARLEEETGDQVAAIRAVATRLALGALAATRSYASGF